MHTTTAGVVGMWYFHHDSDGKFPSNVVFDSLRRCTTLSLGTVAFSSAVTGLISLAASAVFRLYITGYISLIVCILGSLLMRIVEFIFIYIHRFILINIGIEGGSYYIALLRSLAMIKDCTSSVLINDIFLALVTQTGSLCGGIAAVTAMFAMKTALVGLGEYSIYMIWLSFFSGYVYSRFLILLPFIASDSLFFCYYLSPYSLEFSTPALSKLLYRDFSHKLSI